MSIFKLFFSGLGAACRHHRLALRLWAISFLFSLLVIAPLAFALHGQVSHSLTAETILAKLDIHWLTDLSSRFLEAAPLVMGLLLGAIAFFLLLTVFLNGGVIGGLLRPAGRTTLAEFFHDGGLYFWRFLRLALLSIPLYLLSGLVLFGLVAGVLNAFARKATSEWPVMIARSLRLLALVLLLGIVSMFFDYVKIRLVRGNRRGVLQETWLTLKFMARRFFKAWGLYLLAGLAFVLLTLVYLEVIRILPKGKPLSVLLVFLWQQLYILGRQFSRILFYASEIKLAKELEIRPALSDE